VTYLVDDIEGGDADETVKVNLDGTEYEIDLSNKNAQALRDWAKRKGIQISERGRISQEIVEQYHAEAGR
jgi:hypothetical protein